MLYELYIKNFALIEEVYLELGSGFNVLTGETGAGKSILIDAVGVLLGARASIDYVRTGSEKALIRGVFFLEKNKKDVDALLSELSIFSEDDNAVILSREISENGKNICRINGKIVTLSVFQEISNLLVEIHSQGSSRQLTSTTKQRELLDRLVGNEIYSLLKDIERAYIEKKRLEKEKNRIKQVIEEGIKESDFLKFQLEEIVAADLQDGEEDELENELKILCNSQELIESCLAANSELFSNEDNSKNAYSLIMERVSAFKNLRGLDPDLESALSELEGIAYQVEELALFFKQFADSKEHNPTRIQIIEDRIAQINNLKRKYGVEIKEILALKDEIQEKLLEIENGEKSLNDIQQKLKSTQEYYDQTAKKLHDLRCATSVSLEKRVLDSLHDLAMFNVKFKIDIKYGEEETPQGKDKVEYLISPNPGEPLKSLAKIVSGGEMARIMLSLKSILAEVDNIPVVIFDEIDSGIGGRALKPVAKKLVQTSKFSQVICVTHAAQLACYADNHFYIEKTSEDNKTHTCVSKLQTNIQRIEELTRMLGATPKAKEHAVELLEEAREVI